MAELPKFRVLGEIGVEEHDADVIFLTGSGNVALYKFTLLLLPEFVHGCSLWAWLFLLNDWLFMLCK